MKRLLIILFVLVFIAAIPLSHNLMAKKAEKPGKVEICHVNSANDQLEDFGFGRVITVSEKALAAHLKHGDCSVVFWELTEENRKATEEYWNIKLPNANCFWFKQ